MKGIVKKATAVVLAVTVTCGTVMGISVTASAASLSAGAALAGESLSFLESSIHGWRYVAWSGHDPENAERH